MSKTCQNSNLLHHQKQINNILKIMKLADFWKIIGRGVLLSLNGKFEENLDLFQKYEQGGNNIRCLFVISFGIDSLG